MPDPQDPDPTKPPKPDAIMVPAGMIHGPAASRLQQIQDRFGPVLGGRVYCRNQSTFNFLTAGADDLYFFPKDHPSKSGQYRHDWKPSPEDESILYGYLVPDEPPRSAPPALPPVA